MNPTPDHAELAEHAEHAPLIVSIPGVLAGKPVIAGTRISVQLILEKLRDGWTIPELLDDYPQLTTEQIAAALNYNHELGVEALREDHRDPSLSQLAR